MIKQSLLTGVRVAAKRALDVYVHQPRREAAWQKISAPFVFENDLGLKYELDPREHVDGHIFKHGVYERRFLHLIGERFEKDAVALDIGANIGNHTIYLSRTFAQVHAFEPNPNVASRLRNNIRLNRLSNVVVHEVGLGKTSQVSPFRQNMQGNLGSSGFIKAGEARDPTSTTLQLRIEAGDAYVSALGLDRIDFVKIDVEGWEPDVFEGLAATIRRFRPVIAFEHHGQSSDKGDYERIVAVLGEYIMTEAQYAPGHASNLGKFVWHSTSGGKPKMVRFDAPENRTYENILAFPSEQALAHFIANVENGR